MTNDEVVRRTADLPCTRSSLCVNAAKAGIQHCWQYLIPAFVGVTDM